jgi:hypothetical protein
MSAEVRGTNQLQAGQENMEDASMLLLCSFLRNPRPKPTGVLEYCRDGETNYWFVILRGVSF